MVDDKHMVCLPSTKHLNPSVHHIMSCTCDGKLESLHSSAGDEWVQAGTRITLKSPGPSFSHLASLWLPELWFCGSFFLSRAPSLSHSFVHAGPLGWEATSCPVYPPSTTTIPFWELFSLMSAKLSLAILKFCLQSLSQS